MAMADFNRDSNPDLAVGGYCDPSLVMCSPAMETVRFVRPQTITLKATAPLGSSPQT